MSEINGSPEIDTNISISTKINRNESADKTRPQNVSILKSHDLSPLVSPRLVLAVMRKQNQNLNNNNSEENLNNNFMEKEEPIEANATNFEREQEKVTNFNNSEENNTLIDRQSTKEFSVQSEDFWKNQFI